MQDRSYGILLANPKNPEFPLTSGLDQLGSLSNSSIFSKSLLLEGDTILEKLKTSFPPREMRYL